MSGREVRLWGVDLTCGVRQDSVQLGPAVVESINTLLAMLVKRIEVEVIYENAFLVVHFLNDVALKIKHHAVAVFPWRGMIHHEDKKLVFKRPRPEQAAMNVVTSHAWPWQRVSFCVTLFRGLCHESHESSKSWEVWPGRGQKRGSAAAGRGAQPFTQRPAA